MGPNKFKIVALITVFVCMISFPILNNAFNFVEDTENKENRAMTKKPVFDVNYLDPFPQHYEKYYNDTFSIRALLIKYFNDFNLRVYKKSPFPENVVIGYNNWLYLAGNELNTYLGKNRLTNEQLESFKTDLEFQRSFLEERGCKLYFMIIPTKAIVHSENMPYTYFRINNESLGQQLNNYLKKNSSVNVISLFEPLREIKKDKVLYYKHDNHWNHKGAFYASTIASSQISIDFPSVKPLSTNDFTIIEQSRDEGDIVRMLGNPEYYEDLEYLFISKKTNSPVTFEPMNYSIPFARKRGSKDGKRPKLMIMGDSFSNSFFPFMAQSFGESVCVFDSWKYQLNKDTIEQEKPDVYLLMMYEPFAVYVPNNRANMEKKDN